MEKRPLFDTHAHYDHPLFGGLGPEIVRSLHEKEILNGVVIPPIEYESNFHRYLFPEAEFPYVYFAAGLHPKCATNEPWWDKEKQEEFASLLEDPRTVAVKTGLDFFKTKLTEGQKAHQIRFFRFLIDQANRRELPLVLHIRNAAEEAIEVLKTVEIKVPAVVHCFSYDWDVARRLMEVGVTHFGIGGMLTRKEMAPLRECVKKLQISAILLETDAPFVRPEGFVGEVNTSETLMAVVEVIAKLKSLSFEEVIVSVQHNAVDFYRSR